MKTVFSSNEECLHIWAQQKQPLGRATSVLFRDNVAYSYGVHFPMAIILTTRKGQIALVTTRQYSVTTEKHKYLARSAVHGLMPSFPSPDIHSLKEAIKYSDDVAKGSIQTALKRMKVANKSSIKFELDNIRRLFERASELRSYANRTPIFPNPKDLAKVSAHLKARLKRYRELNTPEMLAKREEAAAKRTAQEQAREERRTLENIRKFRAGEAVSLHNLPFDLLRIKGDEVQTSRGARVPLAAAKRLYLAICAGKPVEGQTIGDFTVTGVEEHLDPSFIPDCVIAIGCHRILLSEARALFGDAEKVGTAGDA